MSDGWKRPRWPNTASTRRRMLLDGRTATARTSYRPASDASSCRCGAAASTAPAAEDALPPPPLPATRGFFCAAAAPLLSVLSSPPSSSRFRFEVAVPIMASGGGV